MRLLVRRIYRAFPELDRFSDDQCRRFVRAANRGWRRRLHWALIMVVVAGGVILSLRAADMAFDASNEYQNSRRQDLFWADALAFLASVPLVMAGPIAGLIAGDLLLRRRLRKILRTDSACPKCSYGLVGLAVSEQCTITCPECGFVASVDAALSELTTSAEGRQEFRPSIIAPPPARFWTRRRTRLIVRITAVIILCPLLLYAGLLWWIGAQVRAATAWKPRPLGSIAESRQPAGGGPGTPNGWEPLREALELVHTVDRDFWGSMGMPYYPRPLQVLIDPSRAAGLSADELKKESATAMHLMEEYRKKGVYDRLAEVASRKRAIADQSIPWLAMRFSAYGSSGFTDLADICAVRMELAGRSQDLPEFMRALEVRLALARVLKQQADGATVQLGAGIEISTLQQIIDRLAEHPAREWLDQVDAAMARQSTPLPSQQLFEADYAGFMTSVRDAFMDLGQQDWIGPRGFIEIYQARRSGIRLGSFAENQDCASRYFAAMEAYAQNPPSQRPGAAPCLDDQGLGLFRYFCPDESELLRALDENLLMRRGYETLAALERFRLARGDYPQKLEELVPELLASVPLDPYSGARLGYVRVDPVQERQKRPFLLYSVGNDRTDNRGWFTPSQGKRPRILDLVPGPFSNGFDYVINEAAEPEAP